MPLDVVSVQYDTYVTLYPTMLYITVPTKTWKRCCQLKYSVVYVVTISPATPLQFMEKVFTLVTYTSLTP